MLSLPSSLIAFVTISQLKIPL